MVRTGTACQFRKSPRMGAGGRSPKLLDADGHEDHAPDGPAGLGVPVPLRSGPAALAGPADHLPPAGDVTGNKAKRGREVPIPADLASSLADLVSMRPRDRQLPIFDISWQWVSTRAGSPPRCCSGGWDTGPWPRRSDTWSWPAATTPGWSGCSNRIRVGMLARHLFRPAGRHGRRRACHGVPVGNGSVGHLLDTAQRRRRGGDHLHGGLVPGSPGFGDDRRHPGGRTAPAGTPGRLGKCDRRR